MHSLLLTRFAYHASADVARMGVRTVIHSMTICCSWIWSGCQWVHHKRAGEAVQSCLSGVSSEIFFMQLPTKPLHPREYASKSACNSSADRSCSVGFCFQPVFQGAEHAVTNSGRGCRMRYSLIRHARRHPAAGQDQFPGRQHQMVTNGGLN